MKTIKETKEYTIIEKRSKRYGVRNNETRKWINGEEKIKILLKEKLIKAAPPKKVEEPKEEVAAEATTEGSEETKAEEEAPAK